MSFLLDPFLLVGAGAAIGGTLDGEEAATAEKVTIATFYTTSGLLYLNAPGTKPVARMLGSESGRDFMLNSGWFGLGLLRFDPVKSSARRHLTAIALFATYPVWLRIGRRIGERLRAGGGRHAGGRPASNRDVETPLATTESPEETVTDTAATPA